jgi:hypothetical protein
MMKTKKPSQSPTAIPWYVFMLPPFVLRPTLREQR